MIPGGARGIGASLSEWLAAAGADLAVCARTPGSARDAAASLTSRFNVRAVGQECDVSRPDEVTDWTKSVIDQLGSVDIAIANAAVFGPVGEIESVDIHEWFATMAINVGGVAALAHAVIPTMRARGAGRFLAMTGGGVGGPRPLSRASAYVSSKAAVGMLVEALSDELTASGVTINAVAPGAVPTEFMRGVIHAGPERAGADLYRAASDKTPTDLSKLRSLIEFLLSDEAGWISGRILSANWDSPESLSAQRTAIQHGSQLRLRRIDSQLYSAAEGLQK